MNKFKKSFTFVEFMLAMSIIGFLVALLIPALDRSKPDQTTMIYRKTFFTIEEAVAYIINNPKLYKTGDLLYPVAKESAEIKTDDNGYYLCRNIVDSLNTIGRVRCEAENYSMVNAEGFTGSDMTANQVNFKIPNGAVIGGFNPQNGWSNKNDDLTEIPASDASEADLRAYYGFKAENSDLNQFITLCIDVNGPNKGLNEGCSTTHRSSRFRDQFRIRIARNGKVYTGNSLGANNWYAENLMLINPRAITISKQKWTENQKTNLNRSASSANRPQLTGSTSTTDSLTQAPLTEFGYIKHDSISRWVYTGGIVPSHRNQSAYTEDTGGH